MRHSHFNSSFVIRICFVILALVPLSGIISPLHADEKSDLAAAKKTYAASSHDESARLAHVKKLAAILDGIISKFRKTGDRSKSDVTQSIYDELKKFPAPKNSDSSALKKLRIGKWASPRHEYLFRANGTWSMLPLEPDATAGDWRIEGNTYIDDSGKFTIILLDEKYFIYTQGGDVFFEARMK